MTTSTISSPAASFLTQNIQSVNTQSKTNNDKENSGALGITAINTAGSFLQNVIQSLQGLGLNVSGVGSTQTAAVTGSSSATSSNTSKALQTFLYDLYKVLNQGRSEQTSSDSTSSDDYNSSQVANVQNTYNDPNANLQNLINSLGDKTNSNTGKNATLQTDFANLVQSLGGSTSSSTTTNLQSFLKQLSANTGNGNSLVGGLGSLFSAVA